MAKQKKTAVEEKVGEAVPRQAILLEIENVAFKGRQLLYDVVKKVLGNRDMDLSVPVFCRYCVHAPAQQFVPSLLKLASKTRLSEERAVADISSALKHALDGSVKVEPAFKDLIRIASERKVLIGGLSSMDKDVSVRILSELGLPDMGNSIFQCTGEQGDPQKANAWLQLAKSMSVMPSQCVTVTTSAAACKATVAARMRSVVVSDKFTCFQDFGGANVVFDSLDKDAVEAIFDLLNPTIE